MKGSILFKSKQVAILLALRDSSQSWYISSLAKATQTTYVHACNFIIECERLGVTKSEKHGKIKLIKLTDRGLKLAEMLAGAKTIINESEVPASKQQEVVKG